MVGECPTVLNRGQPGRRAGSTSPSATSSAPHHFYSEALGWTFTRAQPLSSTATTVRSSEGAGSPACPSRRRAGRRSRAGASTSPQTTSRPRARPSPQPAARPSGTSPRSATSAEWRTSATRPGPPSSPGRRAATPGSRSTTNPALRLWMDLMTTDLDTAPTVLRGRVRPHLHRRVLRSDAVLDVHRAGRRASRRWDGAARRHVHTGRSASRSPDVDALVPRIPSPRRTGRR